MIRFLSAIALILFTAACAHTPLQYDFSVERSGETLDCTAGDLITVTLPKSKKTDFFWKEAKPVHSLQILGKQ